MARRASAKCGHCQHAIVICEAVPPHDGCDQARGYVHARGKQHTGTDGHYAEPATQIEPKETTNA